MKKVLFFIAAICCLFACEPVNNIENNNDWEYDGTDYLVNKMFTNGENNDNFKSIQFSRDSKNHEDAAVVEMGNFPKSVYFYKYYILDGTEFHIYAGDDDDTRCLHGFIDGVEFVKIFADRPFFRDTLYLVK